MPHQIVLASATTFQVSTQQVHEPNNVQSSALHALPYNSAMLVHVLTEFAGRSFDCARELCGLQVTSRYTDSMGRLCSRLMADTRPAQTMTTMRRHGSGTRCLFRARETSCQLVSTATTHPTNQPLSSEHNGWKCLLFNALMDAAAASRVYVLGLDYSPMHSVLFLHAVMQVITQASFGGVPTGKMLRSMASLAKASGAE